MHPCMALPDMPMRFLSGWQPGKPSSQPIRLKVLTHCKLNGHVHAVSRRRVRRAGPRSPWCPSPVPCTALPEAPSASSTPLICPPPRSLPMHACRASITSASASPRSGVCLRRSAWTQARPWTAAGRPSGSLPRPCAAGWHRCAVPLFIFPPPLLPVAPSPCTNCHPRGRPACMHAASASIAICNSGLSELLCARGAPPAAAGAAPGWQGPGQGAKQCFY